MILTFIVELLGNAFMWLFSLVNIPGIPNDLLESAYDFLDVLFSNAQIVGLFVRLSTIKGVAIILIVICNFFAHGEWAKN